MKRIIAFIAPLLIASVLFAGENTIDFDGKTAENASYDFLPGNQIKRINKIPPETILKIKDKSGRFSIIKPTASWIDENGDRTDYYVIPPDVQVRWVIWCPGNGEWSAKQSYGFSHDKYGGHYHYSPPPPALLSGGISETPQWPPDNGYYPAPSPIYFPVMEGNSKRYYYYIWYPEFSTKIVEWLEPYGACEGMVTHNMSVMIDGLIKMPESPNYKLIGGAPDVPEHPDNHYAVPAATASLAKLAKDWKDICPKGRVLEFNDMSLMWGGLFDVKKNWRTPHKTHRKGINVDIRKWSINKKDRKKFLQLACKNFGVISEGDNPTAKEKPHYHLIFGKNDADYLKEYLDELKIMKKSKKLSCCPVEGLSEEELKKCIELGPGFPEHNDIPTCE